MSRRRSKSGTIIRHRGWWVLRYRERAITDGELRIVQRARKLGPIGNSKCKKPPKQIVDEAEQVRAELASHPTSPDRTTRLGDFVERIYLPFIRAYKRPSTAAGYQGMWNLYLLPRCSDLWLREVETFHIQRLLEQIAREHGVSKTTLGHIKHLLSGIFRHAAQQGFRSAGNPVTLAAIPAFAPKGKEKEAYTIEEIQAMLKILPEPAATAVETDAWTGLRESELRGLTWDCYQAASDHDSLGVLEVRRAVWRNHVGEPKTERSKAPVPIIPQLAQRLAAHRKACGNPINGPIFANGRGNPMSLDALYSRQMRDILKKAGIPWKGWHGFRRGLASNLNRLGVDDSVIQAILRHSTVAVTQKCYIKTTSQDAVAAMQLLAEDVTRGNCSPLDLQNEVGTEKVTVQ
jgi:integrase